MSMKDIYALPLRVKGREIYSAFNTRVVTCDDHTNPEELCAILNAHFAPKKIQRCEKCKRDIYLSYPEPLKACSCGALLVWVDPPSDTKVSVGFTAPAPDPQPNAEETDRVAVEWHKSGRKLEVQYWNPGCQMWCSADEFASIDFNYKYAWRIAPPATERQVWDVFRSDQESREPLYQAVLRSDTQRHHDYSKLPNWTLVSTMECEVEA